MTWMEQYFRCIRLSIRLIGMGKHRDGRKMFEAAKRLDKLMQSSII